jgi:GDP-4-dehydro-6-deoxy-D-mannose reductase
VGLSRRGISSAPGIDNIAVDLRDADSVHRALAETQPEVVYHLAALSSVGRSWEEPARTLADNTSGAVNLLEAIRHGASAARVVWVSTCEVYGVPTALPIPESAPMRPANPYAVSKATGEMLAAVYAQAHGLDLVVARPFSHSGPGQLPIFLLSSLAKQAAQGRRTGVSRLRIVTGNPNTRRDFTDVRDVVEAYRRLGKPGTEGVYNVSSGSSVSAAEQVALLAEVIAPIEIEHVVDPTLVRAHEVMDLRGDHSRLSGDTGWEPLIELRQTLTEAVAWWEQRLGEEAAP